jgi:hypothetical protein
VGDPGESGVAGRAARMEGRRRAGFRSDGGGGRSGRGKESSSSGGVSLLFG